MQSFKPYQPRDAWGTIRGYVYQVQTTILEWIRLKPGEELHLEYGEDIDHIQQNMSVGGQDLTRLLEQVKHRERSVSLRSVDVVQAISSFFRHTKANEEQKLRFRYLTNAVAAIETNSPLSQGRSGVEVWEDLRLGRVPVNDRPAAIRGIRNLLIEGTRSDPPFHTFLTHADDADLLKFVECIEWSTGRPGAAEINQLIKSMLVETGRATDGKNSQEIIERLFFYVFNLLSRKGKKVLTIGNLEDAAESSALSVPEKKLFAFVSAVLEKAILQLDEISERVDQHDRLLGALSSQVEEMIAPNGKGVDYELLSEEWTIPKSVKILVHRESAIKRVEGILAGHQWCAIHGDIQSGKTQLAIVIAERWTRPVVWASLDGLSLPESNDKLSALLREINSNRNRIGGPTSRGTFFPELEPGSLVVVDGLPRIQSIEPFGARLIGLIEACNSRGLELLTTSAGNVSTGILDRTSGKIEEYQVPRFSVEERIKLFRIFGAPPALLEQRFQNLVGSATRNHPALLNSVVRFLKRSNWTPDIQTSAGFISGDFGGDIVAEVDQVLKATVPDGETRDLLYRLNLSNSPFAEQEVSEIAEVKPAIRLPLERFRDVLGSWIAQESGANFQASPLLAILGSSNLSEATKRSVHRILGSRFFKRRQIRSSEAIESFSHFRSANELMSAAMVLVISLGSFRKVAEKAASDGGISDLWANEKLPVQIEMKIRLYLRSLQIAVRFQLVKDYQWLLKDLDDLLAVADAKDAWGILGSCVTVVLSVGMNNASIGLKYLRNALRVVKVLEGPNGEPYKFPQNFRVTTLIWAVSAACNSGETVQEWLEVIGELSTADRKQFFDGRVSEEGCSAVCDGIWLNEDTSKESSQRDWLKVLDLLRVIETRGRDWEAEELTTAAIRAQIIVYTDYVKNMDEAVRLAKFTLSQGDASALTKFLIGQVIGGALLNTAEPEKALEWLAPITDFSSLSFPRLRMLVALQAGAAVSTVDPRRAVEFANRGVEIARKDKRLRKLDIVIALAEKTLAVWNTGDRVSSFGYWEEALTRMLECEPRDAKWKRLFKLLGHASGYFCSMSAMGRPPEPEYVAPTPGFFLIEREQLDELYDPQKDWFMPAQLAMFAEGVGRLDAASEWALRAVNLGRRLGGGDLTEGLVLYAIPKAIEEDRFGDALELALSGADALTKAYVAGTSETKRLPSEEEWRRAETKASGIGLVPAVFRLAKLWLSDREKFGSALLSVIDKCKDLEKRARTRGIWSRAGEAIEESFVDECDWHALYERATALERTGDPAARVIYFVGALLHATPADSLRLQLAVLPFLEETYGHYGIYRWSIIPFVRDFWLRNIESEAFRYSQPVAVRRRLVELNEKSQSHSEKEFLSEVSVGLGVRVSGDARAWLNRRKIDNGR